MASFHTNAHNTAHFAGKFYFNTNIGEKKLEQVQQGIFQIKQNAQSGTLNHYGSDPETPTKIKVAKSTYQTSNGDTYVCFHTKANEKDAQLTEELDNLTVEYQYDPDNAHVNKTLGPGTKKLTINTKKAIQKNDEPNADNPKSVAAFLNAPDHEGELYNISYIHNPNATDPKDKYIAKFTPSVVAEANKENKTLNKLALHFNFTEFDNQLYPTGFFITQDDGEKRYTAGNGKRKLPISMIKNVLVDITGININNGDTFFFNYIKATDFSKKDLNNVIMSEKHGKNLVGMDFSGANLKGTDFSNCDIRGARIRGGGHAIKPTDGRWKKFVKTIKNAFGIPFININEAKSFKGAIMDHTTQFPLMFRLKNGFTTAKIADKLGMTILEKD